MEILLLVHHAAAIAIIAKPGCDHTLTNVVAGHFDHTSLMTPRCNIHQKTTDGDIVFGARSSYCVTSLVRSSQKAFSLSLCRGKQQVLLFAAERLRKC